MNEKWRWRWNWMRLGDGEDGGKKIHLSVWFLNGIFGFYHLKEGYNIDAFLFANDDRITNGYKRL